MKRLTEKLSSFEEKENNYKGKLQKLEIQLDEYKSIKVIR